MANTSTHASTGGHPVIYVGRFVNEVADAALSNACSVLNERDVVPRLATVLNRATVLIFLDPFSFPFGAMADEHWIIPMVVVLPSGSEVESLATTFGSVLFERLGFFDYIVTSDYSLWEKLRLKYGWAEGQHIPVLSDDLNEITATVCAVLEVESTSPHAPKTVGINRGPCFGKALHSVQVAALKPRFAAAREKGDSKGPLDVLNVGTGGGRWALSFDLGKTHFVGLDVRQDLARTARVNFPDRHFDSLDSDLLFPYNSESFDLVLSVAAMYHVSAPGKRTLLSEMWRVARPGGRLLFLEDFVFTRQLGKQGVYLISITEFVDLILNATAGQVVLEYVESLRYPGEDLHTGGLISLLKLGVPRTY